MREKYDTLGMEKIRICTGHTERRVKEKCLHNKQDEYFVFFRIE